MGTKNKLRQAAKKNYALRTGYYVSGSVAGFGLQNERMRRGLIAPDPKKLAKYKELFK